MQATSTVPLGSRTIPFGEFLAALIGSLGERGVRLHVLRNYEGFPANNNSRDLDLLIRRTELPLAIRALRSIQGIRVVGYAERYYVASVILEGVSVAPGARALQVDFYLDVTWKGIPYLPMETLLHAAIPRRAGNLSFFVLHPVHEAIISLFSGLLLGGALKEKYFPPAQRIFAASRLDAISALRTQFGEKTAAELVDTAIEGDRRRVIACIRALRVALALRSLRNPLRSARNIARHYAREFAARLTPQDLETVCILELPGCGKSTVVEMLMPMLHSSSVVVEKRDSGPQLPAVFKLPEEATSENTNAEAERTHPVSTLAVLRWLLDEWKRQFIGKALPTLRVCESGYYDLLAEAGGPPLSAAKWFLRLVGRILPRADLWMLIDPFADGTHPIGPFCEASEKISAYRSFVKTRNKYAILDGSKPPSAVAEDAYAAIIDALAERANRQLKIRFE